MLIPSWRSVRNTGKTDLETEWPNIISWTKSNFWNQRVHSLVRVTCQAAVLMNSCRHWFSCRSLHCSFSASWRMFALPSPGTPAHYAAPASNALKWPTYWLRKNTSFQCLNFEIFVYLPYVTVLLLSVGYNRRWVSYRTEVDTSPWSAFLEILTFNATKLPETSFFT